MFSEDNVWARWEKSSRCQQQPAKSSRSGTLFSLRDSTRHATWESRFNFVSFKVNRITLTPDAHSTKRRSTHNRLLEKRFLLVQVQSAWNYTWISQGKLFPWININRIHEAASQRQKSSACPPWVIVWNVWLKSLKCLLIKIEDSSEMVNVFPFWTSSQVCQGNHSDDVDVG